MSPLLTTIHNDIKMGVSIIHTEYDLGYLRILSRIETKSSDQQTADREGMHRATGSISDESNSVTTQYYYTRNTFF